MAILSAGPIGLGQLMLAKASGAEVLITDVVDHSLSLAKELGADIVANPHRDDPEKLGMEWTDGRGADIVFECAGGPSMPMTLPQATRMVRRGGKVVIVGGFDAGETSIPLEWQRIQMSEIDLTPTASFAYRDIYTEQGGSCGVDLERQAAGDEADHPPFQARPDQRGVRRRQRERADGGRVRGNHRERGLNRRQRRRRSDETLFPNDAGSSALQSNKCDGLWNCNGGLAVVPGSQWSTAQWVRYRFPAKGQPFDEAERARRTASQQLLPPDEVADAVIFLLTRPRGVDCVTLRIEPMD